MVIELIPQWVLKFYTSPKFLYLPPQKNFWLCPWWWYLIETNHYGSGFFLLVSFARSKDVCHLCSRKLFIYYAFIYYVSCLLAVVKVGVISAWLGHYSADTPDVVWSVMHCYYSTGWVKKSSPPTSFNDIFAWVQSFCINFYTLIGNLYPRTCTDFRLFILTFNEMALILLRPPIIFYGFKFGLFSRE